MKLSRTLVAHRRNSDLIVVSAYLLNLHMYLYILHNVRNPSCVDSAYSLLSRSLSMTEASS